MKLVIPVSRHDSKRLHKCVDLLLHSGGFSDHSLLIYHTPAAKNEAHEALERLSDRFAASAIAEHLYEPEFGPNGKEAEANVIFYGAVMHLGKMGNQEPFLWFEVDSAFIQAGALNSIEREYRIKNRPFLGPLVPFAFTRDGKLHISEDEQVMMSCGVYPANLSDHPDSRPLGIDLGKQPPRNPAIPFDVYLRGVQRTAGWANSELINDQWNTGNYRRDAGNLVCDPLPFPRPVRERGGIVPKSAVMVHGCKDDSLYNVILGVEEAEKQKVAAPVVSAPPVFTAPAQSATLDLKEAVESRLKKGSVRLHVLSNELKIDNKTLTAKLEAIG